MNLESLPEDCLVNIFRYLDHKSRLIAMLVCKRFEQVIGHNAEFYGKFKLTLNRNNDENQKIPTKDYELRRCFGSIEALDYYFSHYGRNNKVLSKIFTNVGSKIMKLKLYKARGFKEYFNKQMLLAPNLRKLDIEELTFHQNPSKNQQEVTDIPTFSELKELRLSRIENSALFLPSFQSLESLNSLVINETKSDWSDYQNILFRQKKLRSLSIINCMIGTFDGLSENWNSLDIHKLTVDRVKFPKKESFDNFTNFIRSQQNVKELNLNIVDDERKKLCDYCKILTHLLNLQTLVKIKCTFFDALKNIPGLVVKNHGVKSLIIGGFRKNTNYSFLFQFFPKLETVEFETSKDYLMHTGNLTALSSLDALTELKFNYLTAKLMNRINCARLQKLSINSFNYDSNSNAWKSFAKRNPQIESLELAYDHIGDLRSILEFFPNLKVLKMADGLFDNNIFHEMLAVQGIIKFCKHLEYLSIYFASYEATTAADRLHISFPNLKCYIEESRNRGKKGFIVTLKK